MLAAQGLFWQTLKIAGLAACNTLAFTLIDLEQRIHGAGAPRMDHQNDYDAYSLASMTRKPPATCREVLAASAGDVGAAAAQLFG